MKPDRTWTVKRVAVLIGMAALAGCGGNVESAEDVDEDGDADYSFHCNESRGELLTFQMMADGQTRIDQGTLETWALSRLAEERKAPPAVLQHVEGWAKARQAQRDALRALPPVISQGRVVEPDTAAIDQRMMQAIRPHHAALMEWVRQECGGI